MRGKYLLFLAAWVAVSVAAEPGVRAQAPPQTFTSGHIFVSVQHPEPCRIDFPEAIVEIDPTTGDMSVFADFDDGICNVTGLRFTPDGRRLLLLNYGRSGTLGWIQAFNPDGTSEVILDVSDGISRPAGVNGLAFDTDGNLYVADSGASKILRFPGGAGPGIVFADAADGIVGQGALDFAPNGDLFYASDPANTIIRINPDGVAFVFDPDAPTNTHTMAIDRAGNIFIGLGGGAILRYDNGDPNTLRLLATGFTQGAMALAVSPDQSVVYFAEHIDGKIYSVDAEDGTTTLLANMSELPFAIGSLHPTGMAVYVPNVIPAVSPWGIVAMVVLLLFSGVVVLRRHTRTTPECAPDSSRLMRRES